MAVDMDKVLEALTEKGSGLKDNSDSLLGLAKEVNSVMSEFEKTVKMLESMHVLPAIVRSVGKKYDIDVDSPLANGGVIPASDYHNTVFRELNKMTDEQIGEVLLNGSQKSKNSGNGNKQPDPKDD